MQTVNQTGKADTHIHTTYSDGMTAPEALVDYVANRTDLSVIAITDHDETAGAFVAREHALRRDYALEVIIGQEVTTDEGDIVGLFLRSTLPAYRTAREAVDAIHAQGGLAVAVHPFSWIPSGFQMKGVARRIMDLPLDGVEVRNGFPTNFVANPATAWHNRRGRGHSELGGSDSHVPYTVGQPYTLFPGRSADDLRQAIVNGETCARGPQWRLQSIARLAPMVLRKGLPSRTSEPVFMDEVSRG